MITAKARVQIVVEVDASSWGEDCSILQLYKQAGEAARDTLINSLKPELIGKIRIIGEPKIIGVLTERD